MTNYTEKQFKQSIGSFATGVSVITTSINNTPFGITISSLASVSLTPKLVSFCVDKKLSQLDGFTADKKLAIHILSDQQSELSNRFARASTATWDDIAHTFDENNTPLIDAVVTRLDCTVNHVYDAGDHLLFICEVHHSTEPQNNVSPLLYYQGGYFDINKSI